MDDNDVVQFPITNLAKLVGTTVKVYDRNFTVTGILSFTHDENSESFTVSTVNKDAYASFMLHQVTEVWKVDSILCWKISLI